MGRQPSRSFSLSTSNRYELSWAGLRIPLQTWVTSTGGVEMRRRVRVFAAYLIWIIATAVVAAPTSATQEGHFDRTLSVTGAVDLTVQTGSGNIAVKPGDSSKVEIRATIRADHS